MYRKWFSHFTVTQNAFWRGSETITDYLNGQSWQEVSLNPRNNSGNKKKMHFYNLLQWTSMNTRQLIAISSIQYEKSLIILTLRLRVYSSKPNKFLFFYWLYKQTFIWLSMINVVISTIGDNHDHFVEIKSLELSALKRSPLCIFPRGRIDNKPIVIIALRNLSI